VLPAPQRLKERFPFRGPATAFSACLFKSSACFRWITNATSRPEPVIAVGEMFRSQPRLTPKTSVRPFASNIFVDVAVTNGAIGFVPQRQARQLRFMQAHDAVRIITVGIRGLSRSHSKPRFDLTLNSFFTESN
jgi:hypothetical protein